MTEVLLRRPQIEAAIRLVSGDDKSLNGPHPQVAVRSTVELSLCALDKERLVSCSCSQLCRFSHEDIVRGLRMPWRTRNVSPERASVH
ncbi:hypothetical protein BV25DRAFT_1823755 [Artomyces pyxidatus]|uniref:Uncharacterized protein n=2 Tax=Artomyces pyxidatus TaxID=48021 RepID=A0ACB8SWU6_9AGAM|nr:hypothetical protein BV25DRAFT_1828106 [Artomyces pyxidatus]KAI0064189.1 hypothetical protein BV25DRAFT_1823755 [Artomyces pyxidatus]